MGLSCKDLDLGIKMAKDFGVPSFVGEMVQQLYHLVLAQGGPEQDVNELVTKLEDFAGVKVRAETNL